MVKRERMRIKSNLDSSGGRFLDSYQLSKDSGWTRKRSTIGGMDFGATSLRVTFILDLYLKMVAFSTDNKRLLALVEQ